MPFPFFARIADLRFNITSDFEFLRSIINMMNSTSHIPVLSKNKSYSSFSKLNINLSLPFIVSVL